MEERKRRATGAAAGEPVEASNRWQQEVYVSRLPYLEINTTDEGGYERSRVLELERGSSVDINLVQLVDGKRIRSTSITYCDPYSDGKGEWTIRSGYTDAANGVQAGGDAAPGGGSGEVAGDSGKV